MWKFIIAIPLIFHGLANLSGVFAPWVKGMAGFKNAPWLFSSNITFGSGLGKAWSLVWLASTLCLVTAGAGALLGKGWWLSLAITGCLCSLAAILPWVRAVPPGAYFGVFFDVLAAILLLSPLKERLLQALG